MPSGEQNQRLTEYDDSGNVTKVTLKDKSQDTNIEADKDIVTSYTYDARNQITGSDYDYQTDEIYTYDDNGNRTNTGDHNRLSSDGICHYEYDNEGKTKDCKLVQVARTHSVRGGFSQRVSGRWQRYTKVKNAPEVGITLGGRSLFQLVFRASAFNRLRNMSVWSTTSWSLSCSNP